MQPPAIKRVCREYIIPEQNNNVVPLAISPRSILPLYHLTATLHSLSTIFAILTRSIWLCACNFPFSRMSASFSFSMVCNLPSPRISRTPLYRHWSGKRKSPACERHQISSGSRRHRQLRADVSLSPSLLAISLIQHRRSDL